MTFRSLLGGMLERADFNLSISGACPSKDCTDNGEAGWFAPGEFEIGDISISIELTVPQ
jgi:hypothetical protein